MERHLKGMANHYRIEILLHIANNDRATLDDIVTALGANEKPSASIHGGCSWLDWSTRNTAVDSWNTRFRLTAKHSSSF